MKNIRLIVTDMDGTFLNSQHEISPEFPEVYKELKRKNILFIPASGRQMSGITQYFKNIESEIAFIAENGGYLVYKNEEIFVSELDQEYIGKIIEAIRTIPGATPVLSGKKKAYLERGNGGVNNYIADFYTENEVKDDLTQPVDDRIFKVAVYHPEGSEFNVYPIVREFEKYGLEVVISGKYWLDIMNKNINKGNALEKLQRLLDISPEQTMVFGDYMNDIQMLKKAKYSYAMQNAHPLVKNAASFETLSNDNFGVIKTIKEYLETN